jgi:hypothetical protein
MKIFEDGDISVDEFLPIKAHLNKRGRLIHHYNKYDA